MYNMDGEIYLLYIDQYINTEKEKAMKTAKNRIGKTARLTAILLAILTVAYLFPISALGEAIAEQGKEAQTEASYPAITEANAGKEHNPFRMEEEKEADAVAEDTARRESNVKHFLMLMLPQEVQIRASLSIKVPQ